MDNARHIIGYYSTHETSVQHVIDDVARTIHQSLADGAPGPVGVGGWEERVWEWEREREARGPDAGVTLTPVDARNAERARLILGAEKAAVAVVAPEEMEERLRAAVAGAYTRPLFSSTSAL
jgi:hypothetical protein